MMDALSNVRAVSVHAPEDLPAIPDDGPPVGSFVKFRLGAAGPGHSGERIWAVVRRVDASGKRAYVRLANDPVTKGYQHGDRVWVPFAAMFGYMQTAQAGRA